MTCHNCERRASWLRTRCRTCQSRLPAWYVVTAMGIVVAIYVAFLVVESVF
jgi:prepilin signal peptidase PulO-like enzyme (type II secretory pathway)